MDGWEKSIPDRGPTGRATPGGRSQACVGWGAAGGYEIREGAGPFCGWPYKHFKDFSFTWSGETQGTAGVWSGWSGVGNARNGQDGREPSYKAGSKLGTQVFVLNPGVFPCT